MLDQSSDNVLPMKIKAMNFIRYFILFLGCFFLRQSNLFAQENIFEEYPVHKILTLKVDSTINPATLNYLREGFTKAHKEGFDLILLTLNTPGGLVSTTSDILTEIGQSDIPVAIWITPQGAAAISAGAIMSSAAHLLVMSEGTSIGAATPIEMSGDIKEKDARAKAINAITGMVQGMAEARGRDPVAFGDMVTKAKMFNSKEAIDLKIIDGIAHTRNEFLNLIEGKHLVVKNKFLSISERNPTFVDFEMDPGQKLLNIFASPSLAYILFLLGAALIYFELQAPGGFLAGSLGVICLLLSGIGLQVLPLNFGAMALIILSFILFILEIYITSFGILTLAGLASLTTGSLFLFRTDDSYLHFSHTLIFSMVGAITLFIALMGAYIWWDHKHGPVKKNRNFLGHSGKTAHILNILESEISGVFKYQVKVSGEIWNAKSKKLYKIGDTAEILDEDTEEMYLVI